MRQHGRASISAKHPRALAVCDRCGALYNHDRLQWQYQWVGPRLQNLYRLVCQPCLDIPQEQLKLIVLPPDPVPIANARPENYVEANNPLSAIGANASPALWQFGSRIGNLTNGAGVDGAFDSNINKPAWKSARNTISNSSYNNYVGINWAGDVSGTITPSSLMARVIKHTLASFTAYAPNDSSFLGLTATSYVVQGSPVDTSLYGAWTTLSSGTTAGTAGESITADVTGSPYQFHRIAFLGDQVNPVTIAQLQLNVSDGGQFTS